MTDFASFKHGGVTFPLSAGANSTLRDVDPVVFYMLEFYAAVLNLHIGVRMAQEGAGIATLQGTVAMTLPMDPEPYLQEQNVAFPLLGISRQTSAFEYIGQRKRSVDQLEVTYVLPPVQAHEAERLIPLLKAASAVIDNRTEQAFDPNHTPTGGIAGDNVWKLAGLDTIEVIGAQFGSFQPSPDVYFPALTLTVRVKERGEAKTDELQPLAGTDTSVDVVDNQDKTTVSDVVVTGSQPSPTLASISSAMGSKAGGQPITLTGSGFIVGRRYRALFGGTDASSVRATSATTLTCLTPQYAAYPTTTVAVLVIDQDQQPSNPLPSAYTFTTP